MTKAYLITRCVLDVIYEQQERVFHRDIQTRENNGENTSAQRQCFCPLFSIVWGIPVEQ